MFMWNKNYFGIKNILLTVFKINFLLYIFSIFVSIPVTLLVSYPNKLRFFSVFSIGILPFFILYFVFLSFYYFGISFFAKTEFFLAETESMPKPTKIWDIQQNTVISETNPSAINFPLIKTIFLLPKAKIGKKVLMAYSCPMGICKNSTSIYRFVNMFRIRIPDSFESNTIIKIPYGGLLNKQTNVPGDLFLQIRFLTRLQAYFVSTIQILCLLIPIIIYFVFIINNTTEFAMKIIQ